MKWQRVRAISRRHSYALLRAPQRWFDVAIWPAVDSVMFGAIGVYFSEQVADGDTSVANLLTGIVLFHVIFQAEVSLSTGFMEETWSNNLLNMMTTPLREREYVAGVILFGLFKLAIGVGCVTLVALALFSFDITDLGFSLVPLVALLMVIGWSVGLIVIGLILRVGEGAEILAWGLLAMVMPLSGVFYPVSALPQGLRPVALALPTTHAFAAARDVVQGEPLPWDEMAVATGGTVVLAVGSVLFVGYMLRLFRRRGYISRHV